VSACTNAFESALRDVYGINTQTCKAYDEFESALRDVYGINTQTCKAYDEIVKTTSKSEHNYDPEFGYQLIGRVWPNLTSWIAYSIRNSHPEELVEAMIDIYGISEAERPIDWGYVVPGEFPERLHEETLKSRGMPMSLWMPPTYLWLAVEGLLGVQPSLDGLKMNPALPENRNWIAVKNVPYRQGRVSALVYDGVTYSTHPLKSNLPENIHNACRSL